MELRKGTREWNQLNKAGLDHVIGAASQASPAGRTLPVAGHDTGLCLPCSLCGSSTRQHMLLGWREGRGCCWELETSIEFITEEENTLLYQEPNSLLFCVFEISK